MEKLLDTTTIEKIKGLSTVDMLQQFPSIIQKTTQRNNEEFEQWRAMRLGKITGSNFGKITKCKVARNGKKKGDWSQTAETHLLEIIGEYLTGKPHTDFTSKATDWGIENEPHAIGAYISRTGNTVDKGKFLQLDGHKLIGCTVDGYITEGRTLGTLEIKCPYNTANHVRSIVNDSVPHEYWEQVLGHILISGYDFCDFVSYDPRCKAGFQLFVKRVERADFIFELDELKETLSEYETLLKDTLKKLHIG
jgi:YqaJ-like viral recombinase domain